MSLKRKEEERKFILEFIEQYRLLPALWFVTSPEYSNRALKNEQYIILLSKYRERYPDAVKRDVVQKINSLRTNFRREAKRIDELTKSGVEVSEPSLWYYEEMKFLLPYQEPNCLLSTTDISVEDYWNGNEDAIIEVSVIYR